MPRALNPTYCLAQIELLQQTQPDIMDDDELRELAIASETDLHEFVANIVMRMLDAEEMVEDQTRLMQNLAKRRDRYRARYEAMRKLAFTIMQAAELKKLELVQATLSIRQGQQKVVITDETLLPSDCIRVKREPDKGAIKRFLEEGSTIPGASLSNAEPVLNVRPT